MQTEPKVWKIGLVDFFHLLEGFEGSVHDRYIQSQLADPSTESLVDMCCWVEHKRLCQPHNSFPENLKKKMISCTVNNSDRIQVGDKPEERGEQLIIRPMSQEYFLYCGLSTLYSIF